MNRPLPHADRPTVLFVDDEPNILNSLKRQFHRSHTVVTANGPIEGLQCLAGLEGCSVVVSDFRMPQMTGVQFLSEVRKRYPDIVRLMLTGQADLEAAAKAINQGSIFRFLTKPCHPELLRTALDDAFEQYRLVRAEQCLLQDTLNGSVKMLVDVLSLVSPQAFARARQAQELASRLAADAGVTDLWEINLAALIAQIGLLTLPPDLIQKMEQGIPLSETEGLALAQCPKTSRDLISNIPRLETVGEIVYCQAKRYDGQGPPSDRSGGESLPLGARVLKVALDFTYKRSLGLSSSQACQELRLQDGAHDPAVLALLEKASDVTLDTEVRLVSIADMTPQMTLEQDVFAASGLLVAPKGQEVSPLVRDRLKNFAQKQGIQEPIRIRIRAASQAE